MGADNTFGETNFNPQHSTNMVLGVSFAHGDKVMVRFRRLPREWPGTVVSDNGGTHVKVSADNSFDMGGYVERNRVRKIAS